MSVDVLDKGQADVETPEMRKKREAMIANSPPPQIFKLRAEMLAKGLDPDIVGKQVLEAIIDNQPFIFTDPATRSFVEKRFRRIMSGYDWADKCKALEGVKQSGLLPG